MAGSGKASTPRAKKSARTTSATEATTATQHISLNGTNRISPVASPPPDYAYDTDSTIIVPSSPAKQRMSDIEGQDYICIPWRYIKAPSSDTEPEDG